MLFDITNALSVPLKSRELRKSAIGNVSPIDEQMRVRSNSFTIAYHFTNMMVWLRPSGKRVRCARAKSKRRGCPRG